VCLLTDMDQPLGRAVGNALEVREALETLHGDGPPDFVELVFVAAARLLVLSDLGVDDAEARDRAAAVVRDGSAVEAYERWIRAQGGEPDEGVLPRAPVVREVLAERTGHVESLGATAVGVAALHLGAGRGSKDDSVDHAVGIRCLRKRGEAVAEGEPLAEVHARDEDAAARAIADVRAAYVLADEPPTARRIVLDVVTS